MSTAHSQDACVNPTLPNIVDFLIYLSYEVGDFTIERTELVEVIEVEVAEVELGFCHLTTEPLTMDLTILNY